MTHSINKNLIFKVIAKCELQLFIEIFALVFKADVHHPPIKRPIPSIAFKNGYQVSLKSEKHWGTFMDGDGRIVTDGNGKTVTVTRQS